MTAPETLQQIVAEMRKAAQVERDRSWVGAPHGADEWELDDWADRIERSLPSLAELERDAMPVPLRESLLHFASQRIGSQRWSIAALELHELLNAKGKS